MAWTTTTWANYDWAQAAILNEFVGALNERINAAQAHGVSGQYPAIVVGEDVQLAYYQPTPITMGGFRGWQAKISSLASQFVVSHDAGVELAAGYYDGAATIPNYANLAALFAAAGVGYTHCRRYTTHPDDGGAVAYGLCVAGDIIGPWLFEDLQLLLGVMKWTQINGGGSQVEYDSQGESNYKTAAGTGATEAAAKADALVNYAAASPSSVDGYEPRAHSQTAGGGAAWTATLLRSYGYLKVSRATTPPTSRDIDFYARAYAYNGGEWEDNGDVVANSVFSWFSSLDDSMNNPAYSPLCLGDSLLVAPGWSPNPGPISRGYVAGDPNPNLSQADRVAVERWNFVYP